jgi:hypothetical protein
MADNTFVYKRNKREERESERERGRREMGERERET